MRGHILYLLQYSTFFLNYSIKLGGRFSLPSGASPSPCSARINCTYIILSLPHRPPSPSWYPRYDWSLCADSSKQSIYTPSHTPSKDKGCSCTSSPSPPSFSLALLQAVQPEFIVPIWLGEGCPWWESPWWRVAIGLPPLVFCCVRW